MILNNSDVRRINNAVSDRTQAIALNAWGKRPIGEAAAMLHEMAHRLIVRQYKVRGK